MKVDKHAKKRIRQRFGKRDDHEELADRAFAEGITQSEAKGSLAKYLARVALRKDFPARVAAWKGLVWIAGRDRLITVLPLPHNMLKATLRQSGDDAA